METGMQEFVAGFALPYLRKRRQAQVCEVGSRFGEAARLLAALPDAKVTVIDPCLDCDLAGKFASQPRITLKKGISLAILPQLSDPFDCILIDDTSRLTRKLADALNLYESLPLPEYGWLPSHKAWIQIARRRSC